MLTNIGILWTVLILVPSTFAVIIGSVWALHFNRKPGYLVNTMGLIGFWIAALMPYLHGGDSEPTGEPEINISTSGEFVSFEPGEPVCATGDTIWTEMPESLRGASFWRHNDFQQGRAVFQVEHSGTVYLAATCRWLKDREGSARDKLVRDGWVYAGDAKSSDLSWQIFKRRCSAGEQFNIQTELYTAPVPILARK